MNNIICFLTVNPNELFYNFVKKLQNHNKNYDIYICIDNNDYTIPNYNNEIKLIKINNSICEEAGYKSSVLWLDNKACSRDKSLYYFNNNNINYDYIWFLEEDVFIPSVNTIEVIDNKYNTGDLLVSEHNIINNRRNDWHWKRINRQIKINPPYASSMICAIRCSKKLLKCIDEYVKKYNNLFMDEALFNTISLKNKLIVNPIIELSSIVWRRDWKQEDINSSYLYHPIKCIMTQYKYRN
jgi:hypothetical protein